uniref:Ycf55 n=1 Tax=Cyanidiococcus yangmingshanensis TaxID=2690220 RepID=A0A7G5VUW0_9RHOD|nr:Ycf55 [Cyanidiococcus yangmingshanensis]QMX77477.1 Ycf55 [Cyanidiococcus yangmingshanensis]UNJ15924.1 hypothetical protein [Cyanidioschyzonaceae sp. 3]
MRDRKLVFLIHQIEQPTELKNLTEESLFLDMLKPSLKKELVRKVIQAWKQHVMRRENDFFMIWVLQICSEYNTNAQSWMIKRMMEDESQIVNTYLQNMHQLTPSKLKAMVDDSVVEVSNAVAYYLLNQSWVQQQLWLNKLWYYWWWRSRAESYGIRRLWIRRKYGIDRIWINWPNN